ncbi:hypothetical protein B7P43_G13762 [Cryptotermes secundus]|uniref:LRRNT domain-containing protein n=2 Tax=Cryptotermes secundus TaxID=105785 RepID=A0A2J7QGJ3_9NEOP|nr:SLIT and NTRK-like protein 2 isoform X2 [Cryptotermes secundus]XP_023713509.1 SLIT and NTRK-like protein 2 isoform X2 [Cryptotermes secundus]XP_023713510.1 SLIT and NTRK-like protein 2 isoform X2 [Cryptotermes secundus]XP_033608663.1 SLIT and NTRK-like protein 2 isoform X2 [Cryptotermes secundus]PNF27710.1 hypothetical protein B7P43_G13762 [Cryptotermes secundus]PNF27711.1 hypothetical protein B7P43_G13762 [Cryptotermes secundus]
MRAALWLWTTAVTVLCITASEKRNQYGCPDITDCKANLPCPIIHLDCSNKNFGSLTADSIYPERNFGKLRELWMNHSGITSLGYEVFYNMNSLKSLTLRGNLLDSLDNRVFYSLIDLEHLDISYNKLTSLNKIELFAFQANLRTLLLSFNKLTTLTRMIFLHTIKLDYLDLSFNNLYFLSDYLFSSQEHLSTLLLNGNRLTTINITLLLPLRSIRRFELSENPLHFDCNLRPIVLWCKEMKLDTGTAFHRQMSEDVSQWLRLESFQNCSGNEIQDAMLPASGTNLTKSDYILVSMSTLLLVVLGFVIFTVLQIICCALLYFKMRLRFAAIVGEEKIMQSDTSSNNIHHYDYISSPNMSNLPELPARPSQTESCENSGKLHVNKSPKPDKCGNVQTAALHIADDLQEPCLCIRNDLYEEQLLMVESVDNKSHHALVETPRITEEEKK